jgi:hypothetical protein
MPRTEPQRVTESSPGRRLWIVGLVAGIVGGAVFGVGLIEAASKPGFTLGS